MSRPVSASITHLLYIDDLKIYAASQNKLERVLQVAKEAMEDVGLQWHPAKCSVAHVKRGQQVLDAKEAIVGDDLVIENLQNGRYYKFLGVHEGVIQDEKHTLQCAAKVYLQRMSVIWSSPLSDYNKVRASNQFALPVLTYLMWILHWPITELRIIDREVRKLVVAGGGKHPASSTALMYLSREEGGRGLRSVEDEYKLTKVKAAMKLYSNTDGSVNHVRKFEENAEKRGHQSLITDARRYAEELGLALELRVLDPVCHDSEGNEFGTKESKKALKSAIESRYQHAVKEEKWQGKLLNARNEDTKINKKACFAWLSEWEMCPSSTIAGVYELYEQLLPTRLYNCKKIKTCAAGNVECRMCGKAPEGVAHILAGCSALAQSKYLERHNAALKILYFVLLHDLKLVDQVPPWYSKVTPKPLYENERGQAYWDVPLYAENNHVQANRIDARIVDHEAKKVITLEMSCPWITNREKKEEEKTIKYGPLRWELKQRHAGYEVEQYNIIVDVLGGWSTDMEMTLRKLVGIRSQEILKKMQRSVLSSSLNIARTFKVIT